MTVLFRQKLIIVFLALIAFVTLWYATHPLGTKVAIGGHVFNVELALTQREKEKGLGFRESLGVNDGMLFVYDHGEQYGFWMKGMRFPLDFIWIAGDHVADITENVPPPKDENEQLASYQPIVSVDKILEVNAGTIDRLGIKVGDKVDITN